MSLQLKFHIPQKLRPGACVISCFALLVLMVPPSLTGIIQTGALFLIGTAAYFAGNRFFKHAQISGRSVCFALLQSVFWGFRFYNRWILSSKIDSVAQLLRIPPGLLLGIGAVGLSVCVLYSTSHIVQLITDVLSAFGQKTPAVQGISLCLGTAVLSVCLAQTMVEAGVLSMGWGNFLWGIATVFAFLLFLYCVIGKIGFSALLGTALIMIICTVNAYVFQFRGRLFEPVDIFSFGTAMNVADNYSIFPIPPAVKTGWGIWCGVMALVWSTQPKAAHSFSWKKRSALAALCIVSILFSFFRTDTLRTYHWKNEGALFNGYLLDFVSRFSEAYVSEPEHYSVEKIESLSERYSRKSDSSGTSEKPPHIIVVMDEAFSDLRVVADIRTNQEVMPFVSSVKENAVYGYALASVYGGNTANSEFEFLTGNSMAWLSPNAVPYNQYIRTPQYSMVSYLKTNYGYNCVAMHPFLSSGWNRPAVYANFGFDKSLFEDDFPQEHYVRDYISDQEMFETIVNIYENKGTDPLFVYGVTVQNHGGYNYEGDHFTPSISLVGYKNEYPTVEQYLSLVHESDRAIEYLVSYFETVNEDVLIVFYGDHQPNHNAAFMEEAGTQAFDTLESQQRRYMVPFFIWANYDIEEAYLECTSLNYLSSYVYDAAGIALPPYNLFLSEMESVIPAMNANGFYSAAAGTFLPFEESSPEELSWLENYRNLQYNALIDSKNRNFHFFPIVE